MLHYVLILTRADKETWMPGQSGHLTEDLLRQLSIHTLTPTAERNSYLGQSCSALAQKKTIGMGLLILTKIDLAQLFKKVFRYNLFLEYSAKP